MKSVNTAAVILAAGKGTRMRSKTPKVLQNLAGRPLITYVIEGAQSAGCSSVIIVDNAEQAIQAGLQSVNDVNFVVQDPPLGTGHAVLQAMPSLSKNTQHVLIMYGDVPLISVETLKMLQEAHLRSKAVLTFATAKLDSRPPYGRIIRDANGMATSIVEHKDATDDQKKINEYNVGLYLVESSFLKEALSQLTQKNVQGEYYLTDLVAIASKGQYRIETIHIDDALEWQGINTHADLAILEKRVLSDRVKKWQLAGVRFENPEQVYLDEEVKLSPDVLIQGPCRIQGCSIIESDVVIEMGCVIKETRIAKNSHIKAHSYLEYSYIGESCSVGPFAHLRPGSDLANQVKVGNFVEIKKSKLGDGSKVSHLSYLGDALIGAGVNIGCGTITCNYDGYNKFQTVIEDGVFIGSDSQLVAPVTIGENAFVGAGSTITKNVSAGSLAVARSDQREIAGWAEKFKTKASRKQSKSK